MSCLVISPSVRSADGIGAGSFSHLSLVLCDRFVLIFQWFCWSTRANVLAPLHVVEVRMVFRLARLISFGRSVCRVALAVEFFRNFGG